MANTWFDKDFYLTSKLAQLQKTQPTNPDWQGTNALVLVKQAIESAGFTLESHFQQFGSLELTSPNKYFNAEEYLAAKAAQLGAGWTAAQVALAIKEAGLGVYEHFQKFGWKEGVNPSNAFDVEKYFVAKQAQLAAAGTTMTLQEVKDAFAAAGLDPAAHALQFAATEGVAVAPVVDPVKPPSASGTTYALTKALDNIPGTAGDDTIIGSTSSDAELNTLSELDIINGGAGTDTLKITTDGKAVTVGANVTNVEVVDVTSAAGLTVNTAASAGVQTLKVGAVVGTTSATASAATDIEVKQDAVQANKITVNGGKNVSVTLVNASVSADDKVEVGSTTAATGDVAVAVTGAAYAVGSVPALGDIKVTGGKTISVTQVATSNSAAAASKTAAADSVAQGNVAVIANAATTTVTVKQDAAVAAKNAAPTTGGVTETVSVKFAALKSGETVSIVNAGDTLTFTAKVDLTAAEVAAAFAGLVDGKVPTAGHDTQAGGLASKGTYSGLFQADTTTGFTSGAAEGDVVVFTATKANTAFNTDPTVFVTSSATTKPVATVTVGKPHDATYTGGVLGVSAGKVEITGGAALKTVSVDGYAATGSAITGVGQALETVNLSNGGAFAIDEAAATLALNLKNVGTAYKADGTGGVAAAINSTSVNTTTLNVQSNGTNTVALTLNAATKALNVSGTGLLDARDAGSASLTSIKVTETAGLRLNGSSTGNVTSVDTSGTTGEVTLTVDAGKATYVGGAGKDIVTIGNVTTAFNKSFDLGAGDDSIDLTLGALTADVLKAAGSNAIKGGEGTDTIKLDAAVAADLSKDATFAGKIDGFEKLSLGYASAAGTVDLSNLDNINYVVSENSVAVTPPAVAQVFSVDFKDSGTIIGADTVKFGSTTLTLAGDETPGQIALKFGGLTFSGWTVSKVEGSKVFMTSTAAGASTPVVTGDFTVVDTDANVVTFTTALNTPGLASGPTPAKVTLTVSATAKVEDADTLTFLGTTITLANGDEAANIASKIAAGTYSGWTTSVSGSVVEFTQVTATDYTVAPAAPSIAQAASNTTKPVIVVATETAGANVGTASPALTINKLATGGTLELTGTGAGVIVNVTDAAKGTADVLNVVTSVAGNVGTVKAAEVETINISVTNKGTAASPSNSTLTLDANAAKSVVVTGAGKLTLDVAAAAKVATVDASAATGALTLDLSAHNGVAVTVTGGSANDTLHASTGTNAKADVLVGGAGHDTLYAGSNGAKLTGGEGHDLFVLQAGNKESNTYSSITDFQAGDVLALKTAGGAVVSSFTKLQAALAEGTATFANFVDAAIAEAANNAAVWFQFGGNGYVVIDQVGGAADAFANDTDSVIQLVGVDLNNASFSTSAGTVALV